MSAPPLRQRVIDDTDPTIQYESKSWFIAVPSIVTNSVGNSGTIYQDSTHATTSNASVTFPFNGTSIQVLGTINTSTNSTTNVTDPTWDCFVDDIKINKNPKFQSPENNWVFCEQPGIVEGSHVLTIQVQSKGQPFYLDQLIYTPPPDASFDTAVLIYPNTDPSLSFSSGWRTLDDVQVTNEYGSQVTLSFQGTSVMLLGTIPKGVTQNTTWATYAIDDGEPVNFTLSGLASPQSPTKYLVPLFTTPTLASAPHNLVITYGGDDQHTPLTIQNFYVTNTSAVADSSSPSSSASLPSVSLSSPSASPSSPSVSPSSSPTKHTSTGAVAGGVIAGITLLTALAFFYSRRRRQRRADFTSTNPYPLPMANNDGHIHGQPYGHYPVTTIAPRSKPGTAMVASNESSSGPATKQRLAPAQQQQSNSSPPAVVVVHEDSGVRLPPEQALEPQIVELPPGYSPE